MDVETEQPPPHTLNASVLEKEHLADTDLESLRVWSTSSSCHTCSGLRLVLKHSDRLTDLERRLCLVEAQGGRLAALEAQVEAAKEENAQEHSDIRKHFEGVRSEILAIIDALRIEKADELTEIRAKIKTLELQLGKGLQELTEVLKKLSCKSVSEADKRDKEHSDIGLQFDKITAQIEELFDKEHSDIGLLFDKIKDHIEELRSKVDGLRSAEVRGPSRGATRLDAPPDTHPEAPPPAPAVGSGTRGPASQPEWKRNLQLVKEETEGFKKRLHKHSIQDEEDFSGPTTQPERQRSPPADATVPSAQEQQSGRPLQPDVSGLFTQVKEILEQHMRSGSVFDKRIQEHVAVAVERMEAAQASRIQQVENHVVKVDKDVKESKAAQASWIQEVADHVVNVDKDVKEQQRGRQLQADVTGLFAQVKEELENMESVFAQQIEEHMAGAVDRMEAEQWAAALAAESRLESLIEPLGARISSVQERQSTLDGRVKGLVQAQITPLECRVAAVEAWQTSLADELTKVRKLLKETASHLTSMQSPSRTLPPAVSPPGPLRSPPVVSEALPSTWIEQLERTPPALGWVRSPSPEARSRRTPSPKSPTVPIQPGGKLSGHRPYSPQLRVVQRRAASSQKRSPKRSQGWTSTQSPPLYPTKSWE